MSGRCISVYIFFSLVCHDNARSGALWTYPYGPTRHEAFSCAEISNNFLGRHEASTDEAIQQKREQSRSVG